MERTIGGSCARREPKLIARRRPGEPLLAAPFPGERRLLSGEIDEGDRSAIIPLSGVVQEGHPVPIRRYPHMADPADRLVEDGSHGILDSTPSREGDRDPLPIRGPVRVLDIFGNGSRGPAGEGNSGQRPAAHPAEALPPPLKDGQLPRGGDCQEIGVGEAGAHTRVRFTRSQTSVEVQALAECDIDAAETGSDRGS